MNIEEISEMLGYTRFIPLPQHIIITKEPVIQKVNGQIRYRGLQPKFRKDTIVLTPDMNSDTIFHEIIHTLGFGEEVAQPLGKLIDLKVKLIKNLSFIPKRQVNYQKCEGCNEFPTLHSKYSNSAEHYVLR